MPGTFQIVHQMTGRETRQPPSPSSAGFKNSTTTSAAGNVTAVQLKISGFLNLAIGHRHMGDNRLADIGLPDPDDRNAIMRNPGSLDQARYADGERTNRPRKIAAIAAPIHECLVDRDLPKQIIHIVIRACCSWLTITVLLVLDVAPPMPSICWP